MRMTRTLSGVLALAAVTLSGCGGGSAATAMDEAAIVDQKVISLDQAPEAARQALLKKAKEVNARINEVVVKSSQAGEKFYEAELIYPDGKERDFLVSSGGKPVGVTNEKR